MKQKIFILGKEIWIIAGILASIFLLGVLAGWILPADIKTLLLNSVSDKFVNIQNGADTAWLLGWRVFLNNLLVSFLLLVTGVFFLLPIFFIIAGNGLVVGVFLDLFFRLNNFQPGIFVGTLASLVPHGIFELSAFFISGALGAVLILKLILGDKFIQKFNRGRGVMAVFLTFLVIVVPLLMIAAFMEVTVSDYMMNKFEHRSRLKYIDNDLQIDLDKDFMIDNNCRAAENDAGLDIGHDDSIEQVSEIVYNNNLLRSYKRIMRVSHWQGSYQCKNEESLYIISFYKQDFSADDLRQVYNDIYSMTGFKVIDNNDYFIMQNQAENKEKNIYCKIVEFDDKNIVIIYNGQDREVFLTNNNILL